MNYNQFFQKFTTEALERYLYVFEYSLRDEEKEIGHQILKARL